MFNSGYLQSDLDGTLELPVPKQIEGKIPREYSIVDQIDSPHDQGYNNICVSVCVNDMCKYLCRGTGKPWTRTLGYFFNSRKDRSIDGMTPREALEIALRDKSIKSYARLTSYLSICYAILINGPVLIGLPVYDLDREDFWNKQGKQSVFGYHAVTLVGYNTDYFTLRNSWGMSYGLDGYGIFPISDLNSITESWTIFS